MKITQDKPVGWAIVGLGRLSQGQILPGFAECKNSKVVALVSGHRDKAEKLATQYGVDFKSIYSYETFDKIAENPEIDAVYIVLPNGMHAEYTIRAARAGKHILCEKPMANTAKDCEAMIDACKKADRKLMIAYRCRYEPFNLAAMAAIREGKLGKVRSIVADHGFNIGRGEWRCDKKLAGGGSMMDIGIYSLNAARYLTGEEPTEVFAVESTDRKDPRFAQAGVEDTLHFTLKFPSGALANCTSSYGYAGANRFRAIGERGWLEMEPATSYGGLKLKISARGRTEEPLLPSGSHFAREMEHFSECVRENKTPLTPGAEGLRDIKLIEALYRSARTGKAVRV